MTQPAPHPDEQDWPQRLVEVLEQQHTLVTELSELTERQSALVERRQTEALLDLLARRQRLIDDFTRSQELLTVLTEGIDRRIAEVGSVLRTRIQALIGEIGERLTQVMERDAEDQARLQSARDETGQALTALDAARHARRAYRGGQSVDNRFADRKG